MKESILQYIWQYKLFMPAGLHTVDGKAVEVIDAGKYNSDAGPDFFNAKIKIDKTLWAGNVEIHTLASDWLKHSHQNDRSYDSVILHVVKHADVEICGNDGNKIPQMELPVPEKIEKNYEKLLADRRKIACGDKAGSVPHILVQTWKTALLSERMAQKTGQIEDILSKNIQHLEEAFYIILARSFGFGLNSQPFEMLARSLPLNILAKHKNNLLQIEALLFGQAGFLAETARDDYHKSLQNEYLFLQKKYGLKPIQSSLWKMLRLRPVNFPHIRIAQFAALVYCSAKLFSKILEQPEINYIYRLFDIEPSAYWHRHFIFGENSPYSSKRIGKNSINTIIINTVVPFLFACGKDKGEQKLKDKALSLLENLPSEQNVVIKLWQNAGIESQNAFDSQALLHLQKNYCDTRNCIRCRIGHKILTA
jgi:hypothetical protein